jgi:hypothetical protein
MKMNIQADKCAELKLPPPFQLERQIDYVLRVIQQGFGFNTRQARYVGIYNLHSIASSLKKKKIQLEVEHKSVFCPFFCVLINRPVDVVYMTAEQIIQYNKTKTAKKG